MRTVKLVIAGDSGVGKTSIRGQYISGRFSTGYRATIGADFIAKTVPHHAKADESVTLQIWDTAGQERFSSLSTAFFRGADAALLVYDVTNPKSLEGIRRWWHEFQERAPVPDEYAEDYCCVVVGNKTDLVPPGQEPAVTEADARRFLEELVPRTEEEERDGQEVTPSRPASPTTVTAPYRDDLTERVPSDGEEDDGEAFEESLYQLPPEDVALSPPSASIAISRSPNYTPPGGHSHFRSHRASKSRSRSRLSHFAGGTMTSVNTALSMYHTPSSSLFDDYASARSFSSPSPAPTHDPDSHSAASSPTNPSHLRVPRRVASASTTSSAHTITPSLFTQHRPSGLSSSANTPPSPTVPDPAEARQKRPPKPERRPRLFFASAKTGDSVADVFAYIAQRVTVQREWEESVEARVLHMRESSRDTVYLGDHGPKKSAWALGSCCST